MHFATLIKPHKFRITLMLMASIIIGLDASVTAYIIEVFIESISSNIHKELFIWCIIYLAAQALFVFSKNLLTWCELKLLPIIQATAFTKLIEQICYAKTSYNNPAIIYSITESLELLPRLLSSYFTSFVPLGVSFVVGLYILTAINPTLAALFCSWLVISGMIISNFGLKSSKQLASSFDSYMNNWRNLFSVVGNIKLMRYFNQQNFEKTQCEKLFAKQLDNSSILRGYIIKLNNIQLLLTAVYVAFCGFIVFTSATYSTLAYGELAAIIIINLQMIQALLRNNEIYINYKINLTLLDLYINSLNIATDSENIEKKLSVTIGEITFKEVQYSWQGNNIALCEDAKKIVTIGAEKKLALLGYKNEGKEILIDLLLRRSDITAGEISLDGQPINNLSYLAFAGQVGFVEAEASLLPQSVLDNIRYGQMTADENKVIAAAKAVGLHNFIITSGGYDKDAYEMNFSAAQLWLLSVARVLLQNPKIVIIEETRAAISKDFEHILQNILWDLVAGRTAIILAERAATLLGVDNIAVVAQGRIVEYGPHHHLIVEGDFYNSIWQGQDNGLLPQINDLNIEDQAETMAEPNWVNDSIVVEETILPEPEGLDDTVKLPEPEGVDITVEKPISELPEPEGLDNEEEMPDIEGNEYKNK